MKKRLGGLASALFLLLPAMAAAESTWVVDASAPVVGTGGGYVIYQFKLTTGVWPVAPGHTAGVVYSWDNWNTAQWGTLTWQYNQANGYGSQDEVWKGAFNIPPYISFSTVQFAIYVDDAAGNRTWNNNNGRNFAVARAP